MLYCSKCGRKVEDNDAFCPGCGNRLSKKINASATSATSAAHANSRPSGTAKSHAGNAENVFPAHAEKKADATKMTNQQTSQQNDPNAVQYVYVSKKTGRITNNPHVKTKSEGCLQYAGIALAAVALVLLMVSGTVLLTTYFAGGSGISDEDNEWTASVTAESGLSDVSSEESAASVSSEPVSSEAVSSEPASSESSLPEELTAKYMNEKIKGKWKTDVPYKNMSLPATFEFDGRGNVKCTIKAFLFSKKFEGTYKINDGGKCTLTLEGMKEYLEDDTMVGDLRFVTDDKMEFTVENTVWKLNRTE